MDDRVHVCASLLLFEFVIPSASCRVLMSSADNKKPNHANSARDATLTDQLIGELVQKRRIERNLTQNELAQRINVTARQLQKYEAGDNRISASRLVLCAEALGVPVLWFFERLPRTGQSEAGCTAQTTDEQRLVDHYRQLPEAVREKLFAIVEVLAQEVPKTPTERNG